MHFKNKKANVLLFILAVFIALTICTNASAEDIASAREYAAQLVLQAQEEAKRIVSRAKWKADLIFSTETEINRYVEEGYEWEQVCKEKGTHICYVSCLKHKFYILI